MNEKLSLQLGEPIHCIGCGRTDTGVHAKKFFLHFDAEARLKQGFLKKLNSFLPQDIAAAHLYIAPPEANARFDAVERSYTYLVSLQKNPFLTEYAAFLWKEPDLKQMNEAAKILLQYDDFTALSKVSKDQLHHLCNIRYAQWKRYGDKLVFHITANRFLRGMVRLVVGSLLLVGHDKMSIGEFREMIESKDRKKAGGAAPAQGLYLSDVRYPDGLLKEL